MAVVVITAILAIVGVALFRRHVLASRGTEAYGVIQAVRSAEEAYLAENHVYLNVSAAAGGVAWYPRVPTPNRSAWRNSGHVDFAAWQQLAPVVTRTVLFGYLVNAGTPGTKMPTLQVTGGPDLSAAQPLDWYVIQASGDTNGNGIYARYASTNITGEIYVENEGE
jgi:type IV pilus assembly protein PilA